jgi:hypothetical protein
MRAAGGWAAGMGLVASLVLSWTAGPASADIATPPGRCLVTASFAVGASDGPFRVSSRTLQPSDVVEVPLADTVTWTAEVVGEEPVPREMSGYVAIDLPWPLGSLSLGEWSGLSALVSNRGTDDYDLPASTPRGVDVAVRAEQRENGKVLCSGAATVTVAGSPFDSPATLVSLGGLGVSGVAVVLAGRAKYRSIG